MTGLPGRGQSWQPGYRVGTFLSAVSPRAQVRRTPNHPGGRHRIGSPHAPPVSHGTLRWSDRPPAPTVDDADVARLSPLTRRHLNVHGRYSFTLPDLPGGLRPLRDPD
jgi:hypothetical protein